MGIGPGQRGEQTGIGAAHVGAGVHHQKGAGAVGAFGFPGLQAELPQRGGLLVPQQGSDWNPCKGQTGMDHAKVPSAGHQLR